MPNLRIWTDEEVAKAKASKNGKGSRKAIEFEYNEFIAQMYLGQYATLELGDGDTKPTVRNPLKAAASRYGQVIHFQRTRDRTVIFYLDEQQEEAEEQAEATEAE